MNLVSGLEESHVAFYGVLGGSLGFSALALASVIRHLRYDKLISSPHPPMKFVRLFAHACTQHNPFPHSLLYLIEKHVE